MEESMRSRTAFVSLAAVVLAVAGCGSTKKAATTAATSSTAAPTTTTSVAPPPVKLLTYSVNLTGAGGATAGARNGSGLAIISLNPSSGELCWKFSQLSNVTAPTKARIYHNHPGTPNTREGFPLGLTYEPSGCIVGPPSLLKPLQAHPQSFYLSVETAQFPRGAGAVRGPLNRAYGIPAPSR
jgi:CHRD domain